MDKKQEFAARRKALLKQIGEGNIAVIFAAPEKLRNRDVHYFYRQDSDFYYLTGFAEPEAVAVLIPGREQGEFILFNRQRDAEKEIWDGKRAGQTGACEIYGADQAFAIEQLDTELPKLMKDCQHVLYPMGCYAEVDQKMMKYLEQVKITASRGPNPPQAFVNLETLLHAMRLKKSDSEIVLMTKAAEVSAKAHCLAMQNCQPGKYEYELEATLLQHFYQNGCRRVAYDSIVAGGANACVLHYIENAAPLKAGELVLIDAGGEYQYYAADITRTFPVNGRFNQEQKAIYELVLEAQLQGIAEVHPGNAWIKIQETIVRVITAGLVKLGLLQGDVEKLIADKAYKKFYMHQSGHWLGLDVHDVGSYKVDGQWCKLEAGMTLTVEPGIYISADNEEVDPKWWNIGVRIEDDILVTDSGNKVLSEAVPKTIAEIEALMK